MRKTGIVLAVLAIAAMGACSGQGSGGAINIDLPPVGLPAPVPPPATPTPAAIEPPYLAFPMPPFETLSCGTCKKIAFVSGRDGNDEIYSVNADGSELYRLTVNPARDDEPAWSPDGKRIAFTSDRDSAVNAPWLRRELYIMDADGSNVVRRTFTESIASSPVWSPDGTQLAYVSRSNGPVELWVLEVLNDTSRLLLSSGGTKNFPSWSPDGTTIVFSSDLTLYDTYFEVFQINSDGSGLRTLSDPLTTRAGSQDLSWSPDGKRLAVALPWEHHLGPNSFRYTNWLGVMNADGLGLTLLPTPIGTTFDFFGGSPTWSPDGTTVAYTSCSDSTCDISWVKADGSARGLIIANGRNPDWQR